MKIPCTIMRGGTSKGIILRADSLPRDPAERDRIILRVFGSPDRRQIDGLAGADPLTSKLALIDRPSRDDADIDYTFADVIIDRPFVDYSGYCGNVTSAVAAYAVDEGFVKTSEPITTVRIHNTNTKRIIKAQVVVRDGRVVEEGDAVIAGVPGTAAPIYLDFSDTAGSISGKLMPAGLTTVLTRPKPITVTIMDVGNPMVFVRASDFGIKTTDGPDELNSRGDLMEALAAVREEGAKHLGLFKDGRATSDSIPAVALVSEPANYPAYGTGQAVPAESMDLWARELFIGSIHKAIGVSETVCTAVAALVPGTVVHALTRPGAGDRGSVRVGHPSGVIEARALVDIAADGPKLRNIAVMRTARRLMEGFAYVPDSTAKRP